MPKRARVHEPSEDAGDASTSSRVPVEADFTAVAGDVGTSVNHLWRLPIEVLALALQYLGEVEPFHLRLVGRRWLAAVAYLLEYPLATQLRRDGGVFRFLSFAPRLLCQLGGTMHAMSKTVFDTIEEIDMSNWSCSNESLAFGVVRALRNAQVTTIKAHNVKKKVLAGALRAFSNVASLHSLDIDEEWEKDDVSQRLHLSQLRVLRLTLSEVTDAHVARLCAAFPALEGLDLSRCETMSDAAMRSIATHLPRLRSLALERCYSPLHQAGTITEEGVQLLGQLTSLTSIRLAGFPGLTNDSISSICRNCSQLRSLRLWSYGQLRPTEDIVRVIADTVPDLQVLEIAPTEVSDLAFQQLGRLTKLQVLDVVPSSVSDWGLRRLGRLKDLRYLSIPTPPSYLGVRGLRWLAKNHPKLQALYLSPLTYGLHNGRVLERFRHLRTLQLAGSETNDHILASLGRLPHLQHLALMDPAPITDAGIAALCRPGNRLEVLCVAECRNLTDAALVHLSVSCPFLMELNIHRCPLISDDGLTALSAIRTLKRLVISWCREITQRAVIDLIDNLPDLRELFSDFCGVDRVGRHLKRVTRHRPPYHCPVSRIQIALLEEELGCNILWPIPYS